MPWPAPNNPETIWTNESLTAGANILSSEYVQSSTRYLYVRFGIDWDFAVAPTAGDFIEMYILPESPDGNFPDGSTTIDPKSGLNGVWKIDWVDTSTHYDTEETILLPNADFKILLKSEAAQTALITLTMERFNEPTS